MAETALTRSAIEVCGIVLTLRVMSSKDRIILTQILESVGYVHVQDEGTMVNIRVTNNAVRNYQERKDDGFSNVSVMLGNVMVALTL